MRMFLAARLAGWGECSAQHVTLDAAKCSTEAVSIGVYFHMSVFLPMLSKPPKVGENLV